MRIKILTEKKEKKEQRLLLKRIFKKIDYNIHTKMDQDQWKWSIWPENWIFACLARLFAEVTLFPINIYKWSVIKPWEDFWVTWASYAIMWTGWTKN